MENEYFPEHLLRIDGDRNATRIDVVVSHDLGDRTLVVVILLAIVIGVCGWQIGEYRATASMQSQYMRDLSVKTQIHTNHVDELDKNVAALKEQVNANQR